MVLRCNTRGRRRDSLGELALKCPSYDWPAYGCVKERLCCYGLNFTEAQLEVRIDHDHSSPTSNSGSVPFEEAVTSVISGPCRLKSLSDPSSCERWRASHELMQELSLLTWPMPSGFQDEPFATISSSPSGTWTRKKKSVWPSQPQFSRVDYLVLFCPSHCSLSPSVQPLFGPRQYALLSCPGSWFCRCSRGGPRYLHLLSPW
jgi:hypothetical protein